MSNLQQQKSRPGWVRFAVPTGSKRRNVLIANGFVGLQAGICLFVGFILLDNSTLLGRVGLVAILFSVCLSVGLLTLIWLAIRWVDRNDKWS